MLFNIIGITLPTYHVPDGASLPSLIKGEGADRELNNAHVGVNLFAPRSSFSLPNTFIVPFINLALGM